MATNEFPFIQIMAIIITIAVTGIGAIVAWVNRIGRTEGKANVTSTVIENVIKEIEGLKEDLKLTRQDWQSGNIQMTRLEERLEYMKSRIESLCAKLERMQRERESRERDRGYRGRSGSGSDVNESNRDANREYFP